MNSTRDVLRDVMHSTGTTQTDLSEISGVHQSSISQFLSGSRGMSDDKVNQLLSCMGQRLEVESRHVEIPLTRSERRSWMLHKQLSRHLSGHSLLEWSPVIMGNFDRLRDGVRGEPHSRNLVRWQDLVDSQDVSGIRTVFNGPERVSVEMREVSPFGGILSEDERLDVLNGVFSL